MSGANKSIDERILQHLTNWIPYHVTIFSEPDKAKVGIHFTDKKGAIYRVTLTDEQVRKYGKDALAIAIAFADGIYEEVGNGASTLKPAPGEIKYANDVVKKNKLAGLNKVVTDSPWSNPKHNVLKDILDAKAIAKQEFHDYQSLPQKIKFGDTSNGSIAPTTKVVVTVGPDLTAMMQGMKALAEQFEQLGKVMGDTYQAMSNKLGPVVEDLVDMLEDEKLSKTHPKDSILGHPGLQKPVTCPAKGQKVRGNTCSGFMQPLQNQIIHLNDGHRWKRERIADWLDTLDEQPIFFPQIEVENGKAS